MRVAVLSTSFPRHEGDPAGHFVAAEADALARDGHDVTVIAPGSGESKRGLSITWVDDGRAFGWPGALPRLRARPWRLYGVGRFVVGARRALAERGPFDRVIAHWMVPCAWPVATTVDAPLEVVAHGSDVRMLLRAPRLVRERVLKQLLDRDITFRFASRELCEALSRSADPRLGERSRVELPTLSLGTPPSRASARAALGIGDHTRLVVLASRLVPAKRVDVALDALSLLPGLTVVVLGDGPERRALERRFPMVDLLGARPRDEALTWLAAADLVVSASREEGAPTVVREARALGVPVVTTNAGDVRDWAAVDPELFVVD